MEVYFIVIIIIFFLRGMYYHNSVIFTLTFVTSSYFHFPSLSDSYLSKYSTKSLTSFCPLICQSICINAKISWRMKQLFYFHMNCLLVSLDVAPITHVGKETSCLSPSSLDVPNVNMNK